MSDHHDVPYTPRNEYLCDTSTAETVMHYGGCKCHEQWWGNRYSELEKQRDALIKDLTRSEESREKLRAALESQIRNLYDCGCLPSSELFEGTKCQSHQALAEDSK